MKGLFMISVLDLLGFVSWSSMVSMGKGPCTVEKTVRSVVIEEVFADTDWLKGVSAIVQNLYCLFPPSFLRDVSSLKIN